MAEQIGPFQFKGKLGNLVGKKLNGKAIVTTTGGLTPKRIKDKSRLSNKRIHENWNEFGMATILAKRIYSNLKGKTSIAHFHNNAYARLTGRLVDLRVLDTDSTRGKRKPTIGALSLLKDFRLSDSAFNPWLIQPLLSRNSDNSLTIEIDDPSLAFNFTTERHEKLSVKIIIQQINLEKRIIQNTAVFENEVNYHSDQPLTWSGPLFENNNLISVATNFYLENNGFRYALSDKRLCSCYIAEFFI